MSTQLLVRLVLFVLPLGLDTFALSTVLGVTPLAMRNRIRLALTFAAAEGLMPAVGLLLGVPLGNALGAWSGYLAGAMICGVGLWMWWKQRRDDVNVDKDDSQDSQGEAALIVRAATATGWGLVGLAISVSLDELAVGFSFGVLRIPLVPALVLIALQALVVSVVGQWVGSRLGHQLGERAERVAGPALCLLGLWFIVAQLFGIPL
jgi:putative Mn2+ efflux pump MntP